MNKLIQVILQRTFIEHFLYADTVPGSEKKWCVRQIIPLLSWNLWFSSDKQKQTNKKEIRNHKQYEEN